jgi:hypothetical protein
VAMAAQMHWAGKVGAESWPLNYDRFLGGMGRLLTNYPPRVTGADDTDALLAAWWDVLHGKPWLTLAVFEEAVRETTETVKEYLPSVGQFLDVCKLVWEEWDREKAKATLAALPPPVRHASDVIDPDDPYSCTAAERERWAQEDVAIGQWAARLQVLDESDLGRMTAEDRAAAADLYRRNLSVAGWHALTPAARRAKEQRIEAERKQVPVLIEQARREMRQRLAEMRAARSEGEKLGVGGLGDVERIVWKDGVISHVTKTPPAPPFDDVLTRAERKKQSDALKPLRWFECFCGVSVIQYLDGRVLDAETNEAHACDLTNQLRAADKKAGRA